MLNALTTLCMSITDFLFGWMLYLPRDLTLFLVGTGTALILTVVRLFTTNQEHLKRCDSDKTRLAVLIKEAKKKKDKEALARYRATKQQIEMKVFQAEGKPPAGLPYSHFTGGGLGVYPHSVSSSGSR